MTTEAPVPHHTTDEKFGVAGNHQTARVFIMLHL